MAVLIPEGFFADWVPLARSLVALSDPAVPRADAGARTDRWDTVSELLDSDSGSWRVAIGPDAYIVDLDRKTLTKPDGGGSRGGESGHRPHSLLYSAAA
ncbi:MULTISPECIES: hypothetical protein [unclassified Frondihabitans]|uniref:hypothetical protein n=1 Tax=unclassified Frondihabitans TaxID=2626248 RepID=UPI000F5037D1|nr:MULTISPECIES: hypothetical protein [unclassified Frondihabitans]